MAYPLSVSRVSRATTACVALTLLVSGCTSMRELRAVDATIPPAAYMRIKPGDRVDVEMKDGRQERFRVKAADAVALDSPSGQRYARTGMSRLRHQRFSHAKTWPLVGSAAFILLLSALGLAQGGLVGGS